MAARGRDTQLLQPRARFVEPRTLFEKGRMLGIVRGREVRVDGVERQLAAVGELRDRPLDVVVTKTEAVHPGIDLQVTGDAHLVARGRGLHRARRGRSGDSRRQMVGEQAVQIADTQGTEDQDGRSDTGVPQHDPLFDVSTRQHRGAGFLEGEPDLR